MTPQAERVLRQLYEQDDAERAAGLPSSQRMRSVGRETGHYLNLTVRSLGARHVVEMGSSSGLSAIWLADGVADQGGKVTGTEIEEDRAARANANLAAVGLADIAHVIQGDARESVSTLTEPVDFVFIDAEKDDYVEHFNAVFPHVRVGGVIVADNVISHDVSAYQAMLRDRTDVDTITLPLERGIELTVKLR